MDHTGILQAFWGLFNQIVCYSGFRCTDVLLYLETSALIDSAKVSFGYRS